MQAEPRVFVSSGNTGKFGFLSTGCCPKEAHGKLLSSVGILLFMTTKQVGGLSLYKERGEIGKVSFPAAFNFQSSLFNSYS